MCLIGSSSTDVKSIRWTKYWSFSFSISGKDPDVEKDLGQEKGVTEDGMVGWHH